MAKDVFEAFFRKDLAKRLILCKSASMEAEVRMVQLLRDECGAGFTTKLEGMFRDINAGKALVESFLEVSEPEAQQLGFTCQVLTTVSWPTYPIAEVWYPTSVIRAQEAFKQHYLGMHTGRSLKFVAHLGQCTLRMTVIPSIFAPPTGSCTKKELSMSMYQAIVLLQFNQADTLTFAELQTATGLPDVEIRRTLLSFTANKGCPLLAREGAGQELAESDRFTFNGEFKSKLFRILVNRVQLKETKDEIKKVETRVSEDRQYQVDAIIVRVMKARKRLTHTALLEEVFRNAMFPVTASETKKRIESLLDREYLVRDHAPGTYTYMA
mmetsp:Transcript_38109/g.83284  ORF Transcript_38109/g.83284 Transcript_38109/m.83284 type:complete len:325 (+) Transcript_38109:3-977(+)